MPKDERPPEEHAACSEPQQCALLKARNPGAFEEIKKAARGGSWEPSGCMWAEPDCSMAGGESLVRQILHGGNFLADEFGIESARVSIRDASGISAALPQIMGKAGVRELEIGLPHDFPHSVFSWEGIDGTRIFSRRASAGSTDARELPVWIGELPGGSEPRRALPRNQKGNCKSEILLGEAEFFDVVSSGGYEVQANAGEENRAAHDVIGINAGTSAAYLDRAWKLLLSNQSRTRSVSDESVRDYAKIATLARAVLEPARASVAARIDTSGSANPLIVFNTTSFTRSEVVSLRDGTPIHVEVPPCGYAVIDADGQRPVASFAAPVEVFDRRRILALDNGMLRIIFNRDGDVDSIRDHRADREVLAPNHCGNVFQANEIIGGLESIEVIESTPLRATVRTVRRFGSGSSITQRISLCAGSARIDFDTEADWREQHAFLKVAFPLNVRSARATCEIPYGHVERPTHFNTCQDLPRCNGSPQKWADLSEPDYGVALLNDCKLGCEISGNVMRLMLLQASDAARGHHQFTYSLLPHVGDLRAARVIQAACALNIPLQVVPTISQKGELPELQSFFQVDRPGVIVKAIKRAEKENAVIVRLYEAYGTRGQVTLSTRLPLERAFTADLMERTIAPLDFAHGKVTFGVSPFEIITLKFPLA